MSYKSPNLVTLSGDALKHRFSGRFRSIALRPKPWIAQVELGMTLQGLFTN